MADKAIHLQYYAVLREQRGLSRETLRTRAGTAQELFQELTALYHFTVPFGVLKVAVNNTFADWSAPLSDGDSVVFIPPVAGG